MSDIDDLLASSAKLCNSIDEAANSETRFCSELGYYLALYKKQVEKGSHEIAMIRDRFGDL